MGWEFIVRKQIGHGGGSGGNFLEENVGGGGGMFWKFI